MTQFVDLFVAYIFAIFAKLNACSFELMGYNVSLFGVLISLAVIGIVLSIFWKGGKY